MGSNSADETTRLAAAAEWAGWRLRTALALVGAALRRGSTLDALLQRHPALHDTLDEAARAGLADLMLHEALARLDARLLEAPAGPLARLRAALGLDADMLCAWIATLTPSHAPALAPLVDDLHGSAGQATRATLALAFGAGPARLAVQRLQAAGCLREAQGVFEVPAAVASLVGDTDVDRDWHWSPPAALPAWDRLVLPPALRARAERVAGREGAAWLLHGSAGSGRRTLAGAMARLRGRGLLQAATPEADAALGAACALLDALPLWRLHPAPGEVLAWAPPPGTPGPCALCLPCHGDVAVAGFDTLRIDLPAPDAAERRQHWQRARPQHPPDDELLGLRLPRATLHRLAARLAPDEPDPFARMLEALHDEGRPRLEGVARPVPASSGEPLALLPAAQDEFDALVARCRHRDRLAEALPPAFGATRAAGVRALFKGPSGTGKTLAARHLAAALRRPLYRVDLAATVSKYIGETERNLERAFAAAESLDIVLLLDEGDALLAGRTGVANATDRYANLETNYLLQRLEAYEGVLVVTTNAAERIDPAFARRMDVTIEFALPDPPARLALWHAHLGDAHAVPAPLLQRVALRCALAGGQVRNAALHALLLAVQRDTTPGEGELLQALQREYRKAGQQCPTLDD